MGCSGGCCCPNPWASKLRDLGAPCGAQRAAAKNCRPGGLANSKLGRWGSERGWGIGAAAGGAWGEGGGLKAVQPLNRWDQQAAQRAAVLRWGGCHPKLGGRSWKCGPICGCCSRTRAAGWYCTRAARGLWLAELPFSADGRTYAAPFAQPINIDAAATQQPSPQPKLAKAGLFTLHCTQKSLRTKVQGGDKERH